MKILLQNKRHGTLRLEDSPPPRCGANDVLVHIAHSVISPGTERSTVQAAKASLMGKAKQRPDLVKKVLQAARTRGLAETYRMVKGRLDAWDPMGYSASGIVQAVGANVHGLSVGDSVACGGVGYAVHGQVARVPANLCAKVPEGLGLDTAALTTIGAIAMQGVRQADLKVGELAVVVGLGLVGQMTARILVASGVKVLCVDLNPDAVALAQDHGLEVYSGDQKTQLAEAIAQGSHGQGADGILVCAATRSSDPVVEAAEWCRQRGTIVVVGAVGMDLPREPFYLKEINFKLSCSYGPGRYDASYEEGGLDYPYAYVRWTERRNMESVLALAADGRLQLDDLITHRFDFADVESAYELLDGGGWSCAICLDYRSEAAPFVAQEAIEVVQGRVHLGLIGAGSYVQDVLLPILASLPELQLSAMATGSGFTAPGVASRFGIGAVLGSADDVLATEALDAVLVGTRHGSHARFGEAVLRHGKHLFVEKPLALTEAQLETVETAWRGAGRVAMVGFNRSHAPLTEAILHRMGTSINLVQIRVNAGQLPADHWLHDLESGGGRLLGEGCHFVDLALRLLGGEPVEVSCSGAPAPGRSVQAWDDFVISLKTDGGGVASISYSGSGGLGLGKELVEVFGGGVSAVIDDFKKLTFFEGGKAKATSGAQDKGQRRQMQRFVAACRGEDLEARQADFERAIQTTRVCLAAVRSMRGGAE
ncbi:MAG: oxidoreductase [Myxococcales bacterium]|nr:oxidoreductase [Myxococcales bacterium]